MKTGTVSHPGRSLPTRYGTIPAVMSLVVVGSIAFDSVATPFGERERMLGGSATHFSLAASFFTQVRVVGIVGEDFGDAEVAVLTRRGIDT
ncbi:MAG: PfkB domain protein, partial [Actinobacteria bacterium]|nr:PfkB domain protein [Actinomycetota bacterium]